MGCVRMGAGVCVCVRVCTGVSMCVQVYIHVRGWVRVGGCLCARVCAVCAGVHGCVLAQVFIKIVTSASNMIEVLPNESQF